MEGKALTWYYWLKKLSPVTKWHDFLENLRTRFRPSAYEDPVGAFTKLRQTGSVKDYQTAFEILSNKISGLQEEEVTRKQYPYRNTQAQNNPYALSFKPTPLRLPGQNTIPRLPAPNPVLRLLAPQNLRPNPPFQRRNPYPIKRISPNQMQERRDKGLCYFCDEKYHQGHKCSRPKLYLLEGMQFEGEEEEELEEEETFNQPNTEAIPAVQQAELFGISLHAIEGAPSPQTMRLVGKIGTCLVIVLIDTSSMHSFIDVDVARTAKLPVEEGHLAVKVANGDTLPCLGCYWLRSLRTIQWNFVDLSMIFFVEWDNLFLQGLRLHEKAIEEEHSLSKATIVEGRGIWLQFMDISDSPGGAPIDPAL
ncbi:hypothetical protein I3760_15G139500 [Carya illinoinensis]|nr:hypothetical protein I3760_15G139500 [Carya illinoinensis]